MDGEFGSVSSAHYSSPSQTWTTSQGTLGPAPAITGTSKASSTLRRKVGSGTTSRERQPSVDAAGGGGKNSLSPMNPRRQPGSGSGSSGGAGGLLSPGVSIGGAIASMNSSAGLGGVRPGSPPSSNLAARRRLLGGIRKSAGPSA